MFQKKRQASLNGANLANREILLIVNDDAEGSRLSELLKKLDYQNVHSFKDSNSAIKKFQEFSNSGRLPVVFLDQKLPDEESYLVFTKLLGINPDVKVISETDIEFDRLKKVMDVLEVEAQTSESKSHDPRQEIDSLLKSSTRISVERLSQYTNSDRDKVLAYLQKKVSEGKASHLNDIKEIACNNCNSVKITQDFYCPNCSSMDYKQGKLVEHYSCGNVSPIDSYENGKCPKCEKPIGVLGVDYKLMENFYSCNNCENKFPEPTSNFLCLKCNNKFKINDAKWITSPAFKSVT